MSFKYKLKFLLRTKNKFCGSIIEQHQSIGCCIFFVFVMLSSAGSIFPNFGSANCPYDNENIIRNKKQKVLITFNL